MKDVPVSNARSRCMASRSTSGTAKRLRLSSMLILLDCLGPRLVHPAQHAQVANLACFLSILRIHCGMTIAEFAAKFFQRLTPVREQLFETRRGTLLLRH